MNYLLSGYYGYANAGDEAVLAAMLAALGTRIANATFTVTSGDPSYTQSVHGTTIPGRLNAVPRQHPRALLHAIRACDVFISGGGSLLQDATSVRNVVYYTSLMRMARLARKPVMVYAQGVGPLSQSLSQKLARIAMQRASTVTVRDPDSRSLLQRIGVRREIEVTADPVWALDCGLQIAECGLPERRQAVWCVSLRRWLNVEREAEHSVALFKGVCEAARAAGARLRFLAMQPAGDGQLIEEHFARYADPAQDEVIKTDRLRPRQIMTEAGRCDVMLAMRLHALIFAAAQGLPCVAINYDPKVASLAGLIGAPLLGLENTRDDTAAHVSRAVAAAQPPSPGLLLDSRSKALLNADLAASLA